MVFQIPDDTNIQIDGHEKYFVFALYRPKSLFL